MSDTPKELQGYPVFLVGLAKRRCVVVGGNREAERKVSGLLECDARVTVIAATLTDGLREWVDAGRVEWLAREYRAGDFGGAFLVIVATDDPASSARMWAAAEAEGVLINVMDDAPHCNFIAGSVVRQGPLTIAISTSGCAPALAVRIRERLEGEFGPEYAEFLRLMWALRGPMAARYPAFEERRARWYALADSDVLAQLRAGQPRLARERVAEIVGERVLGGALLKATQ